MEDLRQIKARALCRYLISSHDAVFVATARMRDMYGEQCIDIVIRSEAGDMSLPGISGLYNAEKWSNSGETHCTNHISSWVLNLLKDKIIVCWDKAKTVKDCDELLSSASIGYDIEKENSFIEAGEIFDDLFRINKGKLDRQTICRMYHIEPSETASAAFLYEDLASVIRKGCSRREKWEDILSGKSPDSAVEKDASAKDEPPVPEEQKAARDTAYEKYAKEWKKGIPIEKIAKSHRVKDETVIINLYRAMEVGMIAYHSFAAVKDEAKLQGIAKQFEIASFSSLLKISSAMFKKIKTAAAKDGISIIDIYDYCFLKAHPSIREGSSIMNMQLFNEMNELVGK